MTKLKENYLEWALKHLQKYSDSDFYPRLFEFTAISHNWPEVKDYLLSINLEDYQPKSPMVKLAPKQGGNFRIVHQLDPLDSLIYVSLIREISEVIEEYRIPENKNSACSYRIKPDLEGSFFSSDNGWDVFINKTEELVDKFADGYVIIADITDFYNQIYTHRVNNLIVEAGQGVYDKQAKIIENFLLSLNSNTSRGIPVGPAPSIILAELIMGSIDKKILPYSGHFVRYVDDIRIFFNDAEEAVNALHDLTFYLYSYHRLVFSGEKTKIMSVKRFCEQHMKDEKKEANNVLIAKADELANQKMEEILENLPPYSDDFDYEEEYENTIARILDEGQFELLSSTYHDLFIKAVKAPRDYGMLRHILKQSARYRIRNLVPLVLDNFYIILPAIREAIIYLRAVINERTITDNKTKFEYLLSFFMMKLPFVNIWISHLLRKEVFDKVDLPIKYENILSIRGQALLALRQKDTTWVRSFRDNINGLGPWDKRAVLYSALILPADEMKPWMRSVANKNDVLEKSIASFIISKS